MTYLFKKWTNCFCLIFSDLIHYLIRTYNIFLSKKIDGTFL